MGPGIATKRAARLGGLGRDPATLEAVERRRLQMWTVMSALLLAVSAAVALSAVWPDLEQRSVVDPAVLRISMLGLTLGFIAYVFEKEHHLRRLTHLLFEERVARERLIVQTRQLHRLLEAGLEVTETLELDRVLDVVLRTAVELLDGESGAILLEEDGRFELRAVRTADGSEDVSSLAEPILRGVVSGGQPVLVRGTVAVPVQHAGHVIGVLNVNSSDGADFGDIDVSLLAAFGEHAAAAIVNARRVEADQASLQHFRALEAARLEFGWLAS